MREFEALVRTTCSGLRFATGYTAVLEEENPVSKHLPRSVSCDFEAGKIRDDVAPVSECYPPRGVGALGGPRG